jgi:hypothetical protein
MRKISVATKKRYWRTVGARKIHRCPQYDSFIGIRKDIGELLQML